MLINPNAPREDPLRFWQDELQNCKTLLAELDKAIFALIQTGITEYTIDTGQTRQTVRRADISSLQARRTALLGEIAQLESRLGLRSNVRRVVPGF